MKFQAIVLASFLVMPYALADDQGGLKQDAAPPPPHAIEDGYRGTDDAKKMTVDFAKNMHDGASVSLRGNLISHKGEDRYVLIRVVKLMLLFLRQSLMDEKFSRTR